MFNKISDKSIIEGIRKQDDKTLNWLYDNYFQTVKNYVIKNSGTEEDVSDVFQDSIIILYNQIAGESLNLTTDLKGYFFGIARNIWSSQLRKKRRTTGLDIDLPDELPHEETDELLFERIVSRAFQKLKPDNQTILTLYSDGHSYEEIAVRMNLKNEIYARRKKYLSKEALIEIIKEDPEYQEYLKYRK
ncbi:MAG: RNA polymerase sigma factor [Bacteroidia bacterium]|nr:RNA polymerase sigma factor [Bacteroidia bacterium]